MKNKKLYIFDLDGTLADAYKAIQKSLNLTRHKFGYPLVDFDEVKRSVGRGDKLFIEKFFPARHTDKALKIYRERHKEDILVYVKLQPYAKQVLSFLKKEGKNTAVASNRPRYYTLKIIDKLSIKKYIDYVLCADQISSLKPNPKILNLIVKRFGYKKEETVFIGDMDIDMETAMRAKIDAVYIEGGSSPLESVAKYRDKIIISSLRDIIAAMETRKNCKHRITEDEFRKVNSVRKFTRGFIPRVNSEYFTPC